MVCNAYSEVDEGILRLDDKSAVLRQHSTEYDSLPDPCGHALETNISVSPLDSLSVRLEHVVLPTEIPRLAGMASMYTREASSGG